MARGGRPTSFKTEYVEQARQLSEHGLTDAEMARFFGVTDRALYKWKGKYPDFVQALKVGKEKADQRVERSLYQRAVGYSHPDVHISTYEGDVTVTPIVKHYPPDTTAMIFWLKNRKPAEWRDRQEFTGANGGPIQTEDVSYLTDAERAQRLAALLQRAGARRDRSASDGGAPDLGAADGRSLPGHPDATAEGAGKPG